MDLNQDLCKILGDENVRQSEPMSLHTTFRVGGPADFFLTPASEDELREVLCYLQGKEVPYYIFGNGSNLLVGDKGYRGAVVQIGQGMSRVSTDGTILKAQAGVLLSRLSARALSEGLTGLEFASGIPGTLGGAVVMNAGAYDGEMKQVLEKARILNSKGEIEEVSADQMELGYRTSVFARRGDIVLSAELKLKPGNPEAIKERMDELRVKRSQKQPLEYPSAGSTFKRPKGYYAGKLIQDAGLSGYQVGGAQVSEKHCGFVINKNEATAADISSLMDQVTEKVQEKFQVHLEPEVKKIGEFE